MRLCHDFQDDKPFVVPGPYVATDSGIPIGAIADGRLFGGAENRDIAQHGHGIYTDNGSQLRIRLLQPARAVELTTWLTADVELVDESGTTIYATQLPPSVRDARLESAGRDVIAWVVLTAHSEFILLSMCVED